MFAKDLITDVVPFIKLNETGKHALKIMDIFRVSHLPLVEDRIFKGIISETDIFDVNNIDIPFKDYDINIKKSYVYDVDHVYKAIEIASQDKLSIIPVLDKKEYYLGLITLPDIMDKLAELFSLNQPGSILYIEIKTNDYSLSEIAQIVEGNNLKIVSLYLANTSNPHYIGIILRLNHTDIHDLLATFERYQYKVTTFQSEENRLHEFYEERMDSFMRFINV